MPESWLSRDDTAEHLGVTKEVTYVSIAEKRLLASKDSRLSVLHTCEADRRVCGNGAADGSA